MTPSSTAPRKVNQPMTMSASPRLQPATVERYSIDDVERQDDGDHPEDFDDSVDHEVGAVLHREQQRRAQLNAEEAAGTARHDDLYPP